MASPAQSKQVIQAIVGIIALPRTINMMYMQVFTRITMLAFKFITLKRTIAHTVEFILFSCFFSVASELLRVLLVPIKQVLIYFGFLAINTSSLWARDKSKATTTTDASKRFSNAFTAMLFAVAFLIFSPLLSYAYCTYTSCISFWSKISRAFSARFHRINS